MSNKRVCTECEWHGTEEQMLTAPNPFAGAEYELIVGCPNCLEVETLRVACDEPDCWKLVTCGTLTKSGYRSTCGDHRPDSSGRAP